MSGVEHQFYIIFRHSDEMIKRLEQAGLGYHIQADATTDKLGKFKVKSYHLYLG